MLGLFCSLLLLQLRDDRLPLNFQDVKKFEITIPIEPGLWAHDLTVRVAHEPEDELLRHSAGEARAVSVEILLGVHVVQNLCPLSDACIEVWSEGIRKTQLSKLDDFLHFRLEVLVALLVGQQDGGALEQHAVVRGCPGASA